MELKPGYKQTEVGVIPEDWEVSSCADLCIKIQDGTHFSPTIRGNDFLYLTSKNVRFGYLDITTADRIDAVQHNQIYKRCDVREGDVLLTKDGANTGNAAINTLSEPFSLLSSVAFLRFDPDKQSAPFFLQQLLSVGGQKRMKDAMSGNAITRLTLQKIRKLVFSVPPLPEQRAIATALSEVDGLIRAQEQLIAKKRDLKQAAMQQLLTAQHRLPGFSGEWVTKRLGEVCRITTGKKDVNEGNPNGEYPFYTCAREHTFSDSYSFEGESILIAGNGEVGNLSYCSGKFEAYQRTYVLQNFTSNVRYLWHQLSAYLAASLGIGKIGSSIPYILRGNLAEFELKLPSLPEQTAIAEVLSEQDEELAALEARLAKTRALKQGMMQSLLTGRIRLV